MTRVCAKSSPVSSSKQSRVTRHLTTANSNMLIFCVTGENCKRGEEPNLKELGRGPKAYMKTKRNGSKCRMDELCRFVGNYVAPSEGVKQIEKRLKARKGASYVPHVMTAEHVTYAVWSLENHKEAWKLLVMKEGLGEEERTKARNWKRLSGAERDKYTPKKTKYTSGEGEKRVYGRSLMSRAGKRRFDEIKKNWEAGLNDEETRSSFVKEWKVWTKKNHKCRGHERVEEEAEEGDGDSEGMDGEERLQAPEIAMPGDEGYSGNYRDAMMEDFGGGLPNIDQHC